MKEKLRQWLKTAAVGVGVSDEETVPDCKLADLRLGGCCVQTDAPFPETPLVDLCVKTNEVEVHKEGRFRVAHPGHGMEDALLEVLRWGSFSCLV